MLNIYISSKYNIYIAVFLKSLLNSLYSNMDLALTVSNKKTLISSYACFLTSERIIIYSSLIKTSKIESISNLYKSSQWAERELQEFNDISFSRLNDTRRLLTDYIYHKNLNTLEYKTNTYDLIFQNIYIQGCYIDFFYFYFFF